MNETITAAIDGFIPVATGLVPGSAAKVLTESVFIKDSEFEYIDEKGETVVGAKQNKINEIFNEKLNSVAVEADLQAAFGDDYTVA